MRASETPTENAYVVGNIAIDNSYVVAPAY